MAQADRKKIELCSYMDVCFDVVKGSYNPSTVMYLMVSEMNVVGLVETTIAFVLWMKNM